MRCVRPAHGPRHVQDAVARYPVLFGRHHHTGQSWAVPARQPHVAVDCHAVERRRDRGLARCMHRNACRRVSAYTPVLRHSDWERDIIIRPCPHEGRLKPGSLFISLVALPRVTGEVPLHLFICLCVCPKEAAFAPGRFASAAARHGMARHGRARTDPVLCVFRKTIAGTSPSVRAPQVQSSSRASVASDSSATALREPPAITQPYTQRAHSFVR